MFDPASIAGQNSTLIPTGDKLYDMLMRSIEPDLMTGQIPLLDAKYKNETPGEAAVRAERYKKAFAEYDLQLSAYLAKLHAKAREYQSTARNSIEKDERTKERRALSDIESAIGAA